MKKDGKEMTLKEVFDSLDLTGYVKPVRIVDLKNNGIFFILFCA